MATLAEHIVKIGADLTDFEKQMSKIGKSFSDVGNKFKGIGSELTTKVTAPIIGLGTAATVMFTKFDDKMRMVSATSGATGKEFDDLKAKARELGATTSFSANDAAEGMNYLALAGYDTSAIIKSMPGLLNLAAAGAMDLGLAADIVSDTMSAFGIEASKTTKVADVFAKAQSTANTNVAMLGESFKYAAPGAAAFGMDIEQTTAILAKFADQGVKGSSAGTTLDSMFRDIKKSAKGGAIAIGGTKVAIADANGNFRDMTTILGDVEKATKGMTQAERDAALSSVFRSQSMRGVNILMSTGIDKVKEYEGTLRNADGTAQKMADTMEGGIGGAFREMESAIEEIAISFGETMAPSIKNAADAIAVIAFNFSQLDESTKIIIITLAGLAAAIGPIIWMAGAMMTAIGALMSPIGLTVLAIAGLTAAFVTAYQKSETFRTLVQAAVNGLFNFIKPILEGIKEVFIGAISKIKAFWDTNGQQISQAFQNVFGAIAAVVGFFMPAIQFIIEQVLGIIKGIINGALNVILGIFKTFGSLFTGDIGGVWEGIKMIFLGALEFLWNAIQLTVLGKMLGGIRTFGSTIVGLFTNPMNSIKTAGKAILDGLKGDWTAVLNGIKSAVTSIFGGLKNLMTNPVTTAKTTITNTLNSIKNAFANLLLKIPKPKIPKVTITTATKSIAGVSIPYPKFDINWYKKGGIFGGASVIGVGEDPGVKEAAIPLSGTHMKPFAEEIARQMGRTGGAEEKLIIETLVNLDSKAIARVITPVVDRLLEQRKKGKLKARGAW